MATSESPPGDLELLDVLARVENLERLTAAQQRRLSVLSERHNQLQDSHEALRECLLCGGKKMSNVPLNLMRKIKAHKRRRKQLLFRAVFQNPDLAFHLGSYAGIHSSISASCTSKVPGSNFRRALPALKKELPPQIAVLAGLTLDQARFAMVEQFDAIAEAWTSLPPRPRFSFCCAAAAVGTCIYAFDGTSAVCLNTAQGQWEEIPPMPFSRYSFAVAAVDGMVYLCGGLDSSGNTVATVERYGVTSGTWETLPPMATARSCSAAVGCAGRLYVMGGADTTTLCLRAAEGYVPHLNGWATLSSMPTRRSCCGAAVAYGLIYVVGGHSGAAAISTVEEFEPRLGMWRTVSSMPTPRCDVAVASARGAVYAFGGSPAEHSQNFLRTVERFDPLEGTWTALTPLPSAGRYLSAMLLRE